MDKKRTEILLVPQKSHMNNKLFDLEGGLRQREVGLVCATLKKRLQKKGFEIKTIDTVDDITNAYAVVFFEVPKNNNKYLQICLKHRLDDRLYVVVGEPPATYPLDHDKTKHGSFKRIMTFNSDLVDGHKYIRYDYTIPIRSGEQIKILKQPFSSKKLLCMVSSNKFSSHENELYGERIKTLHFMEKHHSDDFDLYGTGWEKPMIHARWASAVKINGAISIFWPKNAIIKQFKTYRGSPKNKSDVFPKYKFTIAYENCITPGYISEKILEAFLYGCVPIYLGDPKVKERIPANCFIDKRDFPTYEALYNHIANISETEHNAYLDAIEQFLNSKKIYPFTIDGFISSFEKMLELE